MSNPEPYSVGEMLDDLNEWAVATPEQKLDVFAELMACVTTEARHRQDADLIKRLRDMRAKRDEAKS